MFSKLQEGFDHLNIDSIRHTRGRFSRKIIHTNLNDHGYQTNLAATRTLESSQKSENNCKYCDKVYKGKGKCLSKHEEICMFNPKVASNTTYDLFKEILPKDARCPICREIFSDLRIHGAASCLKHLTDFSSYLNEIKSCRKTTFSVNPMSSSNNKSKSALLSKKDKNKNMKENCKYLSALPFFDSDAISFHDCLIDVPLNFINFLDEVDSFNKTKDFSILVLNVDHLNSKIDEIKEILNSGLFDIIILVETKLDEETPDEFFSNRRYNNIRRDRNANGGGLIVFCRKEYKILKQEISLDHEIIFFQILNKSSIYNFLACYNPNKCHTESFLSHLETEFLFKIDLQQKLFILGDLNQDLFSEEGKKLSEFIKDFGFKQYIDEHTRVVTKHYKSTNELKTAAALLDVIIHNNNLINKTLVRECPFSDHKYVVATLESKSTRPIEEFCNLRNLNVKNQDIIKNIIE